MAVAVLVVAGIGFAALGGAADEPARTPAAPPAEGLRLGCARSVSPTLATAMPGRDLTVGALVLVGYRNNAREAPPRDRRGDPDRAYGWKLPLSVRTGQRVTVAVPRRLRGEAAFAFRLPGRDTSRLSDGDAVLRLEACPSAPGAAYTGWPGQVLATRPMCLPIEVRTNGAAPRIAKVPLGARRC